jgi:uncharacterized damage-inducible protein DinB
MLDHLGQLLAHLRWADDRALDSLRAMPSPDAEALTLLAHVLGAEEVWLARLENREPSVAVWPDLDLDGCHALARAVHDQLDRYLAELEPQHLDRLVSYRNSAGVAFESHVADILLHIAMHGAYHRGQVALAVRRAGARPLFTDYIAFVRGGAPATRADAERRGLEPR